MMEVGARFIALTGGINPAPTENNLVTGIGKPWLIMTHAKAGRTIKAHGPAVPAHASLPDQELLDLFGLGRLPGRGRLDLADHIRERPDLGFDDIRDILEDGAHRAHPADGA